MAGFIYYVDGDAASVSLERLAELGLGYAFDRKPARCQTTNTPTGAGLGLLFADESRLGSKGIGYWPEQQTWFLLPPVADLPAMALGYFNDAPPTPADLARPTLIPGLTIQLTDGNHWQIPEIRELRDGEWHSQLPYAYRCDERGKLVPGDPVKEYAHLWDVTEPIATELYDSSAEKRPSEVSDEDIGDCVGELLRANYYLSNFEIGSLELLSAGQFELVVMAACKAKQLLEWSQDLEKKTSQAGEIGSATTDGNAA